MGCNKSRFQKHPPKKEEQTTNNKQNTTNMVAIKTMWQVGVPHDSVWPFDTFSNGGEVTCCQVRHELLCSALARQSWNRPGSIAHFPWNGTVWFDVQSDDQLMPENILSLPTWFILLSNVWVDPVSGLLNQPDVFEICFGTKDACYIHQAIRLPDLIPNGSKWWNWLCGDSPISNNVFNQSCSLISPTGVTSLVHPIQAITSISWTS